MSHEREKGYHEFRYDRFATAIRKHDAVEITEADRFLDVRGIINTDEGNFFPLHFAVMRHQIDVARYFLRHKGADVAAMHSELGNVFHFCVRYHMMPLLAELLYTYRENTRVLNARDGNNNSPLDVAYAMWESADGERKNTYYKYVRLLLLYGVRSRNAEHDRVDFAALKQEAKEYYCKQLKDALLDYYDCNGAAALDDLDLLSEADEFIAFLLRDGGAYSEDFAPDTAKYICKRQCREIDFNHVVRDVMRKVVDAYFARLIDKMLGARREQVVLPSVVLGGVREARLRRGMCELFDGHLNSKKSHSSRLLRIMQYAPERFVELENAIQKCLPVDRQLRVSSECEAVERVVDGFFKKFVNNRYVYKIEPDNDVAVSAAAAAAAVTTTTTTIAPVLAALSVAGRPASSLSSCSMDSLDAMSWEAFDEVYRQTAQDVVEAYGCNAVVSDNAKQGIARMVAGALMRYCTEHQADGEHDIAKFINNREFMVRSLVLSLQSRDVRPLKTKLEAAVVGCFDKHYKDMHGGIHSSRSIRSTSDAALAVSIARPRSAGPGLGGGAGGV